MIMKQIKECLDRYFNNSPPLKRKWQAITYRHHLCLYHYHHLILVYDLREKKSSHEYYEKPADLRGLKSALEYLDNKFNIKGVDFDVRDNSNWTGKFQSFDSAR